MTLKGPLRVLVLKEALKGSLKWSLNSLRAASFLRDGLRVLSLRQPLR